MKKIISALFVFSAFITLSAQDAIINGGFEKMNRWGVALHGQDFASIKQITDDVKEGKNALKFEFTQKPKVYICVSQHIDLKPEFRKIDFTIKYKAPAGGGVLLFSFPKAGGKAFNLAPSKDWKEANFKVDIPANVKSGRLEIRFTKQGSMIVDDIKAPFITENK